MTSQLSQPVNLFFSFRSFCKAVIIQFSRKSYDVLYDSCVTYSLIFTCYPVNKTFIYFQSIQGHPGQQ